MNRSDIELLKILRDFIYGYLNDGKESGLCGAISALFFTRKISSYEKNKLKDLIEYNRPEGAIHKIFWWPPGAIQPRIDFLNKLIEKYENKK